ncbi:MAG TPA: DUF3465 domain-containing protein [Pyrinomonadaceae bacterium]
MRYLILALALLGVSVLGCAPGLARARILSDDIDGSRHQRFILELPSGQTLVVAHNIDVAPRILDLRERDLVAFRGEYEWNAKGGAIHWTHDDPAGRHSGDWLEHKGRHIGEEGRL